MTLTGRLEMAIRTTVEWGVFVASKLTKEELVEFCGLGYDLALADSFFDSIHEETVKVAPEEFEDEEGT
jgi:hypothetical protein